MENKLKTKKVQGKKRLEKLQYLPKGQEDELSLNDLNEENRNILVSGPSMVIDRPSLVFSMFIFSGLL